MEKKPLKIILVAPPYPLEEFPSPPLGISMIAAVCRQHGAEVCILDYIVSAYSPEKLKKQLQDFNPDIIGINAITMNFKKAAEIISEAKKIIPSALTIMGGPHVSFDAENTLKNCSAVDLIFIKEGEDTLAELLSLVEKKETWHHIKGIAYRKNNSVIINEPRPFIENLDKLPLPARDLLPLSRYRAMGYPISITTSRGCPNLCIFCLGRKMVGYRVRYRDIDLILDEIEELINMGFIIINIADDIFTVNKKRVLEFCKKIKERNIVFSWSVFSRVNTIDREMVDAMKDAGCSAMSFGIETGSKDMLKKIKKGITIEQVYRADKICKESGIISHGSFIAGLPGETRESFNETLALQKNISMAFGCHILAPFPGTTISEKIDSYDLEILTKDWNLYDANQAVARTKALSAQEINLLVEECHNPIIRYWENVKKKFNEKQTSDKETLQVLAHFRTRLVFTILSEDLIETSGTWEGTKDQAIEKFISFLSDYTSIEKQYVKLFFTRLMDDGLISAKETENTTQFFWN